MWKKTLLLLSCIILLAASMPPANPPIRAVAFDIGGVLISCEKDPIIQHAADQLAISPKDILAALKKMEQYVMDGGDEIEFWRKFADERGLAIPANYFNRLAQVIGAAIQEVPGTRAIIIGLREKGYTTPALSNVTPFAAAVIRQLGYYDLFHPVFLSCDIGTRKPEAEAFRFLIAQLQLPPASVVFIDDRQENVMAAAQAGLRAIHFENAAKLRQDLLAMGVELD
jgi:HAD superfamily hydrolase (TIGR01509 family)